MLRFLCAVAVMGAHYGAGFWYAPGRVSHALLNHLGYRPAVRFGLEYGWVGVQIFFVISGVMIARSATNVSQAEFLRRRFLRLVPAAWACATITLAIVAAAGLASSELVLGWVRSMLFVPVGEQIDGAYWTIGVETVFYLVVAAAIGSGGSAARLERVAYGLTLISMAAILAPLLGAAHDPALPPSRASDLLLLTHGSFFAIGIMIAQCQATRPALRHVLTIGIAAIPASIQVVQQARVSAAESTLAVSPAVALAIVAVGGMLVASATRAQPVLVRAIDPGFARWMGKMTYPLYLLHMNIGAVVIAVLVAQGFAVVAAIGIAAAVAIAAAALVARVVEPLIVAQFRRVLDHPYQWPRSRLAAPVPLPRLSLGRGQGARRGADEIGQPRAVAPAVRRD
ncbi:MAG TPA: acyltransferase [Sphingomonas sp.]|nr:acyltransferase [Sphingomonas sp.]